MPSFLFYIQSSFITMSPTSHKTGTVFTADILLAYQSLGHASSLLTTSNKPPCIKMRPTAASLHNSALQPSRVFPAPDSPQPPTSTYYSINDSQRQLSRTQESLRPVRRYHQQA